MPPHALDRPRLDHATLALALLSVAPSTGVADELARLAAPTSPDPTQIEHVSAPTRAQLASAASTNRAAANGWALGAAQDPASDPALLVELASHPKGHVVRAVAGNPSTPMETVLTLHRQMLADRQVSYATCTIGRVGALQWLTDVLGLGEPLPKKAAIALAQHLATTVAGAKEAHAVVELAEREPQLLRPLRAQLGRVAGYASHITLPDPQALSADEIQVYLQGLLLTTGAWTDEATDWFATALPALKPGQVPNARPTGQDRDLSVRQVATITTSRSEMGYALLLSSRDAVRHLSAQSIEDIVASSSARLHTALLTVGPHLCTTDQLTRLVRSANLSNLKCGPILELPTAAGLPADAVVALLNTEAKPLWARWLCGHLPTVPTPEALALAVELPRFRPGNGIPDRHAQRRVMAEQIVPELAKAAKDVPAPALALEVTQWLGTAMLPLAVAGEPGNLYARAVAHWLEQTFGTDASAWSTAVMLAPTITGADLEDLVTATRALLSSPA